VSQDVKTAITVPRRKRDRGKKKRKAEEKKKSRKSDERRQTARKRGNQPARAAPAAQSGLHKQKGKRRQPDLRAKGATLPRTPKEITNKRK